MERLQPLALLLLTQKRLAKEINTTDGDKAHPCAPHSVFSLACTYQDMVFVLNLAVDLINVWLEFASVNRLKDGNLSPSFDNL